MQGIDYMTFLDHRADVFIMYCLEARVWTATNSPPC